MELRNPEVIEEYEKFQQARQRAMKTGRKGDVEGVVMDLINNMILRLPGESMRVCFLERHPEEADKLIGNEKVSHTDGKLLRTQTWRQFYETIDRILKEEGVLEQITELINGPRPSYVLYDMDKVAELCISSYFRLRDMGYTWSDLAG